MITNRQTSELIAVVLMVLSAFLGVSGCAAEIGDHCATDGDCPSLCQTGGGFPNGICTQACRSSAECPEGWACISSSGGVCMARCNTPAECADRFDSPWTCSSTSLQEGGAALVCVGP